MFQFLGYSFFSGPDCLSSAPSQVEDITTTRITNAIFDHVNITRNTEEEFNTNIPINWDYDTILNADLNGDLNAGNVDFIVEEVTAIKIKRRIKGEFNWLTLETVPINSLEDLTFLFIDRLNVSNTEYEYALVPIIEGVEGGYLINSILSKLRGVFIGDFDTVYKFMYDVQYGTNMRNQKTGVFTPLGRQYPVIIANGVISYDSGSASGSILNDDFQDTGLIDPKAIVDKKKILKDFLTNKKAKLLRDWNGNAWLCMITDSPTVNYKEGSSLQIPMVNFNWTQIGDENNQLDLYYNGILKNPN